jgi:hypothetical protein
VTGGGGHGSEHVYVTKTYNFVFLRPYEFSIKIKY